MNKAICDNDISSLCSKHTKLTESQIQFLNDYADNVTTDPEYNQIDVFIDVRDVLSSEAIVVFHRWPEHGNSIYKERVVGKMAYRRDEPGPLRSLETAQNSYELYARSQEGTFIKQTSYPIILKGKTIAVLILEEDLSCDLMANLNMTNRRKSYEEVSAVIEEMKIINNSISNYLDDAILMFDEQGFLRHHNRAANDYYNDFGYLNAINGLHYDNLALDLSTYSRIQALGKQGDFSSFQTKEIKFNNFYFKVKTIYLPTQDYVILIMKNITEQKIKESKFFSEVVSIQEIHHRVKNNLQTVVSLLRLQARRSESPEAKKVLNESVNRILSIAATHELLSQQKEDDVQLKLVLDEVITNLSRFYQDSLTLSLDSQIDEKIILDSNKAVTIALVMNELIQNCIDHAFEEMDEKTAVIKIAVKQEEHKITVTVTDNGSGFDFYGTANHNLGLQIVTSFVESKLNGFIVVDSDSNGTKIRIVFNK